MRQVLSIFLLGFLAACNANNGSKVKSANTTDSTSGMNVTKDEPAYPYTPSYSSKFEIGDPRNSKAILDLYRTWDNNTLENGKQFFADTLTMVMADGSVMHGSADSIIAASKAYRNSLGEVTSKVSAWTPLKATDKDENWVLVWYTEIHKRPNGQTDSTDLQETWRLNKNGKADMLLQYERKYPTAKK